MSEELFYNMNHAKRGTFVIFIYNVSITIEVFNCFLYFIILYKALNKLRSLNDSLLVNKQNVIAKEINKIMLIVVR